MLSTSVLVSLPVISDILRNVKVLRRNMQTSAIPLDVAFYDAQLLAASYLSTQLSTVSPTSAVLLYGVGLLASFTPCTLGMVPITLAYLGRGDSGKSRGDVAINAACYAVGLAMTFSSFGLSAVYFGTVVGSINSAVPVASKIFHVVSSMLFIAMGLNLLDLITIKFPSFNAFTPNISNSSSKTTELAGAFMLGATSALLEAPCTSPILAALLTFLSTSVSTATGTSGSAPAAYSAYVVGAGLMFIFSLGYASPLIVLGLAGKGAREGLQRAGGSSALVLSTIAALLISYGSYQTFASIEQLLA